MPESALSKEKKWIIITDNINLSELQKCDAVTGSKETNPVPRKKGE